MTNIIGLILASMYAILCLFFTENKSFHLSSSIELMFNLGFLIMIILDLLFIFNLTCSIC